MSKLTLQLIENFQPILIRVTNDSSKHAHHSAMRAIGGGGGETRKSRAPPANRISTSARNGNIIV